MTINRKISLINFYDSNRSKSAIKYIILHYVGAVSTAKNNADYFYSTFRGASAHYFVDENEIWQVVEDNDSAWAIGANKYYTDARNTNSISIEMCCYNNNGKLDIKEEVVNKAIELTKYLMEKYDIDADHVIRHYDATRKVCPAPFVNDESRWQDFKKKLGQKDTSNSDESEKVIATVKVTHENGLNLRKEATTSSNIIKAFVKSTSLKIYEISDNWGRTDGGWVCLDYTDYKKSNTSSSSSNSNKSSKYSIGRYEVTANVLNVRTGPGTNYDWKKYSQLTANAQKQIKAECGYEANGLVKGVQCDVSEISGNWGKIPSRMDLFRIL